MFGLQKSKVHAYIRMKRLIDNLSAVMTGIIPARLESGSAIYHIAR